MSTYASPEKITLFIYSLKNREKMQTNILIGNIHKRIPDN